MRLSVAGTRIELEASLRIDWVYVYLIRWQGNEHLLYAQNPRTHLREQFLREITARLRTWEKGQYP